MGNCCSSVDPTKMNPYKDIERRPLSRKDEFEEKIAMVKDKPKTIKINIIPFPKVAIFANGLFQTTDASRAHFEPYLIKSSYNTCILSRLGVSDTGDLIYNDAVNTIVSNGELTQQYIDMNLKSKLGNLKGKHDINVLSFSIGGGPWNDSSGILQMNPDWLNITNIILHKFTNLNYDESIELENQLYINLGVLVKQLGINGFDSDCEEWDWWSDYSNALPSNVTNEAHRVSNTDIKNAHIKLFTRLYDDFAVNIFSATPFDQPQSEVGKLWIQIMLGCVVDKTEVSGSETETETETQEQLFKFLNIQNYGGGDPKAWINYLSNEENYSDLGFTDVSDALKLVVPAYAAFSEETGGNSWRLEQSPRDVKAHLETLNESGKIGGACMWKLADMSNAYDWKPLRFKNEFVSQYSAHIREAFL